MDLKDIVAISGMSGLHRIEAQRSNGIIVKPLTEDKKKFISSRQHMFTPLENITIYTEGDGVELKQVFQEMKRQEESNPPVDSKEDNNTLNEYFEAILPDYDKERVYVSDIKKIIKWYQLLNESNLVDLEEDKADDSAEETKAEEKSTKEDNK